MATLFSDTPYYCFSVIIIFISTIFIKIFLKKTIHHHLLNNPPSPPWLPLIGHLHLITNPLYLFFNGLSMKYGPVLLLQFGASRQLLISSAAAAAEIYMANDLAFASRPPFVVDDEKLPYVGSSFMNAQYGEYWKFMKKICVTKVFGPQAVRASLSIREEELHFFLQRMLDSASALKPIDVGLELVKLTNNVVCRMVMSTRCSDEDDKAEKCRNLVQEAVELAVKMSIGDVLGPFKWLSFLIYGKQAKDVFGRFDDLIEDVLKEHEDQREGKRIDGNHQEDLMDILLDVSYHKQAEYKLTRLQIKAFCLDMFVAANDASASAMQWAIAELINRPIVFKKVREEIDSVVGYSRLVEESDIPKLPYFLAVLKEILRLHPSATITPRLSREHCKVLGFDVPRNTHVLINLYAVMRDPNVWQDPDAFEPERFLDSKKNKIEERLSNFFIFGGGRRMCTGIVLAKSMLSATIAAMVQCFDWKICGITGNEAEVDMQVKQGLTHQLANPILCIPIVRYNPFAFVA